MLGTRFCLLVDFDLLNGLYRYQLRLHCLKHVVDVDGVDRMPHEQVSLLWVLVELKAMAAIVVRSKGLDGRVYAIDHRQHY